MSEAQTILTMIEAVSPDDTDTLDEIDARVDCLVNGLENNCKPFVKPVFGTRVLALTARKYTRSRDALKAIRPEGFKVEIFSANARWSVYFTTHWNRNRQCQFKALDLPTEELAELHAIIQAIEWERNQ